VAGEVRVHKHMLRDLFKFTFGLGVLVAFAGMFVFDDIMMMALGGLLATLSYGVNDYLRREADSMDPMTIFALIMGTWMGLGHAIGYMLVDTEYHSIFFTYASLDFLLDAQKLATLGLLVPLLVYPTVRGWHKRNVLKPSIPVVGFEVTDRMAIGIILVLLGSEWTIKILEISAKFLGSYSFFVVTGADIAIFLLTWHWLGPNPTFPKWTKKLLVVAVFADTIYGLLYSYMRGEIIYPFFMVFIAFILRKAVTPRRFALAAVIITAFSVAYAQLGVLRGTDVGGTDRISYIVASVSSDASGESEVSYSLLKLVARNCQFDQLSQVARIAEDDGLYYGETLGYMTYVFIPRIIWPDKPLVTPGQWFAQKLGRGQVLASKNGFSNSINMTLQGEMYLNFGWPGAIVGIVLLTYLFSLFWSTTGFFEYHNNPIGLILGLALLRQTTQSSSAAAIVHLIFMYLAVLSFRGAVVLLNSRRKRHQLSAPPLPGLVGIRPEALGRMLAAGDSPRERNR
jgi:hypothetical protein